MELQEIEVVIDPDGTTRIEVHGVSGPSCLEITAEVEAALGGDVVSREVSPGLSVPPNIEVGDRVRRRP